MCRQANYWGMGGCGPPQALRLRPYDHMLHERNGYYETCVDNETIYWGVLRLEMLHKARVGGRRFATMRYKGLVGG